jgi:hypothetical protein
VPHELRGMYMAALSRLTALRRWATTRNKLKEVDGKA